MRVVVTTGRLNVRAQNRKQKNNVLTIVERDTELEVIKEGPKWTQVKIDDIIGYVMNEFVKKIPE